MNGRGWVTTLVALPDNQHALSGAFDAPVTLFDVNDGQVLRTFRHDVGLPDGIGRRPLLAAGPTEKSPGMNLALLPDGLRFVCGAVYGSTGRTARIFYHGLHAP